MMDKIKGWVGPVIVGAIAGMILLPVLFGFVSGGTATEMAAQAAEDATVAALTPICVANAQAQPDVLAAVMEKSTYQRRAEVSEAGWSTYPEGASRALKRAIDEGCIAGLS
jgi:negative regulator of sigma E activity